MLIEIHEPELEQRVRRQIQTGQYRDVDELLAKALDALEEKAVPTSLDERSGVDLIAALQASPYREHEIEPPYYREPIPVRDVVL
jgi:Arc/MetJ-type ribon-helix-helix transcriptional regulator